MLTGQQGFPPGTRQRILYLTAEAMAALDVLSYSGSPKDMPMNMRDFAAEINTAAEQFRWDAKKQVRDFELLFGAADLG